MRITAEAALRRGKRLRGACAELALKDMGMPADGPERAAELATQNPYTNPRPVEYAGVLALLRNAYVGRTPWSAADAPVGSPEELL